MDFMTWRTSRPDLNEGLCQRKANSRLTQRWWKTLGVATALICAATAGTAATFSLKSGEVIEGEIVQATRNTIVVLETNGAIRQLSRRQMESMRVETKKGQTITGPLKAWRDGAYQIEYGGRLVQVRDRRIVRVDPIPQEPAIAVAEAQPAEQPADAQPEPAAAAEAAPPTEPLSSTTAAIEVPTPSANSEESETPAAETASSAAPEPAASEPSATASEASGSETGGSQTAEAEASEAEAPDAETTTPVKTAELTTATVAEEAETAAPADPEAQAHSDGDPPPRLIVSEVQAGENASELVFKVALSRPVDQPIMVLYATYDRTAIAGEDYKGERGTMTLAPGTSSAVVRIPLIDDDIQEENETFELFVATDERKATIESDRIVGTILNDDE